MTRPSRAPLEPRAGALRIAVAPDGDDAADGGPDAPIRSLREAQLRVRAADPDRGAVVELSDGVWRLDEPLRFSARDGGRPGAPVVWRAAPGARPVISGGRVVTGWHPLDAERGLWRARVPGVAGTRQLYVDGAAAARSGLELRRDQVAFDDRGIVLSDAVLSVVRGFSAPHLWEVECLASFTHRVSPVERIDGDLLVMRQPAWGNNTWGYDTLSSPFEGGTLLLRNVPDLLEPGQWRFDPDARELTVRMPPGGDPRDHEYVVPALDLLVAAEGTLEDPVHDLVLAGLRFEHTSWLVPGSAIGYASQQTGTFLDRSFDRPADALTGCQNGCPDFEATRPRWRQMPAAVRVAAAERVDVVGCTFTRLGQAALGVGNDPVAVGEAGLAGGDILVQGNVFTDVSGGAIVVGGIADDAHHPRDPRLIVRDVVIDDNLVTRVATDYRENAGILSTYVDGVVITRNEVCHLPYDGIDVGFGWGANDAGGSPDYERRGLYRFQPRYEEPTVLRDSLVSGNLVHDTKTDFHDGGAVYTLSAAPGTSITENHLRDNGSSVGLYLDEGSRHIRAERNVVQGAPVWVFTNTYGDNRTDDNTIGGNWYDGGRTHAPEPERHRNAFVDNALVVDGAWPEAARAVMRRAGRRGAAGRPQCEEAVAD